MCVWGGGGGGECICTSCMEIRKNIKKYVNIFALSEIKNNNSNTTTNNNNNDNNNNKNNKKRF